MVDDPQDYFNKLYTQFIQNAGVKTESQEQVILKHYKTLFRQENDSVLAQYKQYMVNGDFAKFALPLALKTNKINIF